MSLLVSRITPQERFPWDEDLTDENVSRLTVMLSDLDTLRASHLQAERVTFFYRETHDALRTTATRLPGQNPIHARIFSHGVAIYEAMRMLANPAGMAVHNREIVGINARNVARAEGQGLMDALQNAEAGLRTERPGAWEVVREAVERFYPNLGHHALYGAGMVRELELAAI